MFGKTKINTDDYHRLKWQKEICEKEKSEYKTKYLNEQSENKKLQNENGYLKALFDKEADTQVIKYNGKLYKIVSTIHSIDVGIEETLNISLVPVREVN